MTFWQRFLRRPARPQETLQLTKRVMDLMSEGHPDESIERTLFREGVPVDRARQIVTQVRRLRRAGRD